jgi:hypothetical protein
MAWTAPMTAVDNTIWTSSQWNTHVRDNLLETMAGKATTAGRWFVSTGANAIAERVITQASTTTSQTTTSASFTDLATVGPAVTVTTGTKAIVFWGAAMSHSAANATCQVGVAISGATTTAASTSYQLLLDGVAASSTWRMNTFYVPTLTAGSNTFTLKYATSAATATFSNRYIAVIAL